MAGVEARGFIFAAPLAVRLGAGFVPVRKAGKLPGPTEQASYDLEYGTATLEVTRDALRPGQRVLLVDDVLATGGTAAAAIELVERMGAQVTGVQVLVELAALAGRDRLGGHDVRATAGRLSRPDRSPAPPRLDVGVRSARPGPQGGFVAEDVATGSPEQASEALAPAGRAPGTVSRPAGARVRNRLARLGGQRPGANPVLDPLLRTVRARTTPSWTSASSSGPTRWPSTTTRASCGSSGDPYITHPLAVATILAELGMTAPTLAAALLHDTVEDTTYTLEQLRKDFGDEVAKLVDGVTKLDKVKYGDAAQSETVRKMVVAMARDIRVLVIKLADRLHNARTWRYVSVESAQRKARETLEIYAPLAHRLGMNTIKWELEDLSFATLYPKVYDEIVRLVAERAPAREEYLAGRPRPGRRATCRRPRSRPRSPGGPSTTTPSTRR